MWIRLTSNFYRKWLMLVIVGMFANYSQAQSMDERPVILAIGESTTAGFGVDAEDSYPAQLQRLLDDHGYAWRVVNHGRSGSTTAMALSNLDRGMLLQPKIVLIALGGNDQNNVAKERTKENLRKLISMFARTNALIFLADRNIAADRADTTTSSLYAELAAEEGAMLMPSIREDIAGHAELLISDGSHPNAKGYTIVANRIFNILKPYLDQSKAKASAGAE
ncbi:MAG: GDSL-type esterase/lipase family protein [Pseudomonadota bacterium]